MHCNYITGKEYTFMGDNSVKSELFGLPAEKRPILKGNDLLPKYFLSSTILVKMDLVCRKATQKMSSFLLTIAENVPSLSVPLIVFKLKCRQYMFWFGQESDFIDDLHCTIDLSRFDYKYNLGLYIALKRIE